MAPKIIGKVGQQHLTAWTQLNFVIFFDFSESFQGHMLLPPAYGVWREGNVFTLWVCPQGPPQVKVKVWGPPRSRSRSRSGGHPWSRSRAPPRSRSRSRSGGPPKVKVKVWGPPQVKVQVKVWGPPWSRSRSRSGRPLLVKVWGPPRSRSRSRSEGAPRSRSRSRSEGGPRQGLKMWGARVVRPLRSRRRTVLS